MTRLHAPGTQATLNLFSRLPTPPQISATWGILSGFPGPLPTLLTNVLGAITDETQFARVASTGVSDANAGVDSCVRVLSVSRGAWAVQGYPASAADCLTVTSDNGAATGTFCIRHW